MTLKTGLLKRFALMLPAIALLATVFLLDGCGQSGQGGGPGPVVTTLTAGPTLSANAEFQQYEKSHFGFFRPAGSYPYVQELGVHWQRPHPGPFVWGLIEKTRGTYDWSQVDQYVKESQDNHVLIDATIWPYADWDQQQCHAKLPGAPFRFLPTLGDYRSKPCDEDAYRRFVTALVERYDGDGIDDMPGLIYPIKYWEVINEPETGTGTPFFKGDPQSADYLEVLKNTSLAIEAADPDAKVLNGGIASLGQTQTAFWDTVLGQGSQYVDVLTIHAVPAPDDLNLVALYNLMDGLNLRRPVWVTEIQLAPARQAGGGAAASPQGITTNGAVPTIGATGTPDSTGPAATTSSNTEADQEKWSATMVRDFVTAFGRGADKLFYIGLDNATPTAPAALLVNCSVVIGGELEEDHLQMSGCQKQKAFYAYQTMAAEIDYFDSVQQVAAGQYKFTIGGRTVYVLWGDQPLPAGISGSVQMTDLYGARKEIDAGSISLTDSPIYVEMP